MILPQIKEQSITCAIDWLESNGLPPLPVAPKQDAHKYPARDKQGSIIYESDGITPKPLFNGKNPSYLDTQGIPHLVKHSKFRKKKPTQAEKDTWWANPANGIGTIASSAGVNWIDIDYKGGTQTDRDNAVAQLLERVPRTYYEQTPSGGYHIAVKLNIPKNFTNFALSEDGPHIGEFLGKGRFVVLAPTNGYKSLNGREIAHAIGVASLGLWPTKGQTKQTEKTEPNQAIDRPEYNPEAPTLGLLISRRNQSILQGGNYSDRSATLTGFARDCYGWENWLTEAGLPYSGKDADALIAEAAQALEISDKLNRCLDGISRANCRPALEHAGKHRPKRHYTKAQKRQKTNPNTQEACKELRKIQQLRETYSNRLRFNRLTQKIELDGEVLQHLEWERIYYIEETNQSVGVDLFCNVLQVIASENAYHPVIEYLDSISKDGGNPDIFNGIASRYFGVDNPLYDVYIKKWMTSAVARAYEPGCKADCALFLQGGQGAGKSTFFEVLASKGFFNDNLNNTKNNKDEILLVHQYWIHEWSELETAFKKKDIAEVKAFLARNRDSVRPPYQRSVIDMPRAAVFCGSTNQQEFLSDDTGERRYWIIPVNKEVDLDLLKQERDQLWAAAVELYRRGAHWWLNDAEEKASKALSARFKSLDPWYDQIDAWVNGKEYVIVNDILTLSLDFDINKINRTEQRRVSSVLTSLGWHSGQKKVNGRNKKVWFPPKPDPDPDPEPTQAELAQAQPVQSEPQHAETVQAQTTEDIPPQVYEALDNGSLPDTIAQVKTCDWYLQLKHCQSWQVYSQIYNTIGKDYITLLGQLLPEHIKQRIRDMQPA